ncbi:MAG: hypothetical protein UZ03_NOB001002717 [Nitrospira sp. OLB3]|nr:MAG: hypothetical protein UZ03_NOB001002717 [Nitrospira sp. OLB3]
MFDCSREIRAFHDEKVRLSEAVQDKLRGHRDANRERVTNGLKASHGLTPISFLIQGSYDMQTIIQQPKNDYDIDDGVIFKADDLHGPQGGQWTPLQVRQVVCQAVQDPRFKKAPEVRTNCVRVYYEEGHNVDIPVYRQRSSILGGTYLELASVEWRQSNPKAVTEWFDTQVQTHSPDEEGTKQQMRRQVRLLKAFAKSRESWNMPSGFILSVLASEKYHALAGREDVSFYETIRGIHSRLEWDLTVRHPVVDEALTKTAEDASMVELKTQLKQALESLVILHDRDCTKKAALQAWGKVFNTDFFDKFLDDEGKGRGPTILTTSGKQPQFPVKKEGGGRYG